MVAPSAVALNEAADVLRGTLDLLVAAGVVGPRVVLGTGPTAAPRATATHAQLDCPG